MINPDYTRQTTKLLHAISHDFMGLVTSRAVYISHCVFSPVYIIQVISLTFTVCKLVYITYTSVFCVFTDLISNILDIIYVTALTSLNVSRFVITEYG